MPRKPRRVSSAPDAVEGAAARPSPNVQKGLSGDGLHVSPLSPKTRFDAVRAVTYVHQQQPETPETVAASGEVMRALGLVEGGQRPPGNLLSVACPTCGQPAGQPCRTLEGGNDRYTFRVKRHAARIRLAEQAPNHPAANTEES